MARYKEKTLILWNLTKLIFALLSFDQLRMSAFKSNCLIRGKKNILHQQNLPSFDETQNERDANGAESSGSALWLVLVCTTALIGLCSVMSYRLARSAEIAQLIKQREKQYEHAEEIMHCAINECAKDWNRICDLVATNTKISAHAECSPYQAEVWITAAPQDAVHLNVDLQEKDRRILTLSCDLLQTKSQGYIAHWKES